MSAVGRLSARADSPGLNGDRVVRIASPALGVRARNLAGSLRVLLEGGAGGSGSTSRVHVGKLGGGDRVGRRLAGVTVELVVAGATSSIVDAITGVVRGNGGVSVGTVEGSRVQGCGRDSVGAASEAVRSRAAGGNASVVHPGTIKEQTSTGARRRGRVGGLVEI